MISDGCTGFWFFQLLFPAITGCCAAHDFGATDGNLVDCLESVLPMWTWPVMGACVTLMLTVRPIYHWFKEKL